MPFSAPSLDSPPWTMLPSAPEGAGPSTSSLAACKSPFPKGAQEPEVAFCPLAGSGEFRETLAWPLGSRLAESGCHQGKPTHGYWSAS